VDVKGLPVQSGVGLQSLVTEETPPPLIPPVDHGQLRLRLHGVRHHQENLPWKNRILRGRSHKTRLVKAQPLQIKLHLQNGFKQTSVLWDEEEKGGFGFTIYKKRKE